MLKAYCQAELTNGVFFHTALTDVPNPGISPPFSGAFAITSRVITLF